MRKIKLSPNFSRDSNRRFRQLPNEFQWMIYEDLKSAFFNRLQMFEKMVKVQ